MKHNSADAIISLYSPKHQLGRLKNHLVLRGQFVRLSLLCLLPRTPSAEGHGEDAETTTLLLLTSVVEKIFFQL